MSYGGNKQWALQCNFPAFFFFFFGLISSYNCCSLSVKLCTGCTVSYTLKKVSWKKRNSVTVVKTHSNCSKEQWVLRTEWMIVNIYTTQRILPIRPLYLMLRALIGWTIPGAAVEAQSHTRMYTRTEFSILSCGISHTLVCPNSMRSN